MARGGSNPVENGYADDKVGIQFKNNNDFILSYYVIRRV